MELNKLKSLIQEYEKLKHTLEVLQGVKYYDWDIVCPSVNVSFGIDTKTVVPILENIRILTASRVLELEEQLGIS